MRSGRRFIVRIVIIFRRQERSLNRQWIVYRLCRPHGLGVTRAIRELGVHTWNVTKTECFKRRVRRKIRRGKNRKEIHTRFQARNTSYDENTRIQGRHDVIIYSGAAECAGTLYTCIVHMTAISFKSRLSCKCVRDFHSYPVGAPTMRHKSQGGTILPMRSCTNTDNIYILYTWERLRRNEKRSQPQIV